MGVVNGRGFTSYIEEGVKRHEEGPYQAVGYRYETEDEATPLPNLFPLPIEHPPTTSVDIVETAADIYNFPSQLYVPGYIDTVSTTIIFKCQLINYLMMC